MSTIHNSGNHVTTTPDTSDAETRATSTLARRALAVLRIAFGLTFLWAFFDKLLALGFSTGRSVDPTTGAETVDRFGDAAWINGGNPTLGFLKFAADGPFKDFYHSIAGDAWTNWAFMLALLGIGLALTLGIGMRIACAAGALLYVMMWTVVLPPENNPVLDDHLLGAITMVVLAATGAGMTWGLGRRWAATEQVKRNTFLR
jgi:thiosulfate dehydrogenase [quinone] large subunit